MLKFKCYGSIFIFKNEQLIQDLKSIVLVSDFCLFTNQLKSKEYYDNFLKNLYFNIEH